MKTAFKIVPVPATGKEYHLLAEVGRDTISFVWYSKTPLMIEGLFSYQPGKDITDSTLAADLQKLLASENFPHYLSCSICYNFKESLLVPAEFYPADKAAEMLDCIYGENSGSHLLYEHLQKMDAFNIYRVPGNIHTALTSRFYAAGVQHSNSLLIPFHAAKDIYCIVYNSYIKTFLFKEGKLQLVQLYDYNTPSDVAYHLLNTCAQHDMDPSAITLTLSGFIDQQSNLYEELYRYFLQVNMDTLPEGTAVSDEIKTYPEHFFSFLTTLVTCVS